jgi:hypothetical protein
MDPPSAAGRALRTPIDTTTSSQAPPLALPFPAARQTATVAS